jgi:LPXTG-motif cell wall-anchored protein
MRKWQRVAGAAALLAGTAVTSGTVEAGDIPDPDIGAVTISVLVYGFEADNIDDWRPELFVDGTDEAFVLCGPSVDEFDEALHAGRLYECPVTEETTFTLGFPTPPENYQVEFECRDDLFIDEAFDDPGATFTIDGSTTVNVLCDVVMWTNMVFVDKLFPYQDEGGEGPSEAPVTPDPDGGAEHGDFTIELYDGDGELVGAGSDDDGTICDAFEDAAAGVCLGFEVPPGFYGLGEITVPGYQAVDVFCGDVGVPGDDIEGPEGPINEVPLGLEQFPVSEDTSFDIDPIPGFSYYCQIINQYFEGSVTLTKTITNDSGRNAQLGDFTLELYRADGTLVDSGECGDDGVCLQGDYPIGDYVVGEVGPDGYTRTVTQEVGETPLEQLTEPGAAFTLEPFAEVTINVKSDDEPLPPTTTTTTPTTTTLPATTTTEEPATAVPTTQGPTTTAIDAGVVTLPATGGSDNTGTLAAVALALLLLGAGTTALARRRT